MDWPLCKLQVCKFVLIEFAPPEWQNVFHINVKNFTHLQMDTFCYFDFCHCKRNTFCIIIQNLCLHIKHVTVSHLLCEILNRKPRHASYFLFGMYWFQNVIFEKIPWAPSEVAKVKWWPMLKFHRNQKGQKFFVKTCKN